MGRGAKTTRYSLTGFGNCAVAAYPKPRLDDRVGKSRDPAGDVHGQVAQEVW